MAKKRKKSSAKKAADTAAASPARDVASATSPAGGDQPAPSTSEDEHRSRGARRRQAARAERARSPVSTLGPAPDPTFWFGFEITWAKLALARVVVFVLLAIDALLQISHAPRYGAGGFNVAQLPLFDAIAPGRVLYSSGQLVLAYLFVLAACGVATRYVLPIATVLYGWLYFASHLDSYQHHYLVWLILLLACFVPWQRPADAEPATRVRSWAVRLILVQLGILYFWAAISKLSGAWIDGRTLASQMQGSVRSLIEATVGFKGAAWIVILVELALAGTVWIRRAWIVAAPLGIALHVGILKTNLDIGLFAYLMLGLYILVVPDRVWTWLAERRPLEIVRGIAGVVRGWFAGGGGWVLLGTSAGVGLLLARASRFDHGWPVGLALLVLLVGAAIVLRRRESIAALALGHLLALGTWTAVDRTTKTASDYFRLWGGSARRLGDPKTSEHAYRRMTEIAPGEGNGYYQLGRLLLDRNADEEGIAALRKAQDLEPLRARAYLAEARWLASKGRKAEAIAKAREATIVEPDNAEAATLLNSLLAR